LIFEIPRITGICRLSVGRIIQRSFQSHPCRGKQPACLADNVFSGNVATQLMSGGKFIFRSYDFQDAVCQNYEHHFKLLLSYRGKSRRHFLRHVVFLDFVQ